MKFIFTCTILASITTSLLAADQEGTQNVSNGALLANQGKSGETP
jgi:hypothetical protein